MKNLLGILLALISFNAFAQSSIHPSQTIEGVVSELLDLITIEKGNKPDTAAIRNLFLPSARLTMLSHGDPWSAESVSIDEFIILLDDPYYEQGFTEKELHKVVDQYNGIGHVFQTYYAKDSEGVEETGINSYQLVYLNDRWWISSLLWTINDNGVEIPARYLGR